MPNNSYPNLPTVSEVITALCDRCLGEGQEVKVYKIDTKPDLTVQKSLDAPSVSVLKDYLQKYPFKTQPDVFGDRNFAQPIAQWSHPDINHGEIHRGCLRLIVRNHSSRPEPGLKKLQICRILLLTSFMMICITSHPAATLSMYAH